MGGGFIACRTCFLVLLLFVGHVCKSNAFPLLGNRIRRSTTISLAVNFRQPLRLNLSKQDDDVLLSSDKDLAILGAVGTASSVLVLYSEFTLKTTGCGLPAGPAGLVGLFEGLSYVCVTGLAGFSLYKKVKTGNGLPAGPNGMLGAAEGLSFLAILAGLVVLGFQVLDYGYIPNAVPTEGGLCQ